MTRACALCHLTEAKSPGREKIYFLPSLASAVGATSLHIHISCHGRAKATALRKAAKRGLTPEAIAAEALHGRS